MLFLFQPNFRFIFLLILHDNCRLTTAETIQTCSGRVRTHKKLNVIFLTFFILQKPFYSSKHFVSISLPHENVLISAMYMSKTFFHTQLLKSKDNIYVEQCNYHVNIYQLKSTAWSITTISSK